MLTFVVWGETLMLVVMVNVAPPTAMRVLMLVLAVVLVAASTKVSLATACPEVSLLVELLRSRLVLVPSPLLLPEKAWVRE